MRTVWKFRLPIGDEVAVKMPRHAELLHVAEQEGRLCLWARVDPDAQDVLHILRIAGTGHPVEAGRHIGSVLMRGGALVLHVFDLGEREVTHG